MSRAEQFGAIPVRAFSDTRLSAADFRVLGAIAYYDRFGRNNLTCFATPDTLAKRAALGPRHLADHTKRLAEFGYLKIQRSAADRRKRVYSLIYDDPEVVSDSRDKTSKNAPGFRDKTRAGINCKSLTSRDDSERNTRRKDPAKRRLRDPVKRGSPSAKSTRPPQRGEPTLVRQGGRGHTREPHQIEIQAMADVGRRALAGSRLEAEARLGNDLVREGLAWRLPADLSSGKAYEKACEIERQRPGNGWKYLRTVLRQRTAVRNAERSKRRASHERAA